MIHGNRFSLFFSLPYRTCAVGKWKNLGEAVRRGVCNYEILFYDYRFAVTVVYYDVVVRVVHMNCWGRL